MAVFMPARGSKALFHRMRVMLITLELLCGNPIILFKSLLLKWTPGGDPDSQISSSGLSKMIGYRCMSPSNGRNMMMSWHGQNICIIGVSWEENPSVPWIPHIKTSDDRVMMFPVLLTRTSCWSQSSSHCLEKPWRPCMWHHCNGWRKYSTNTYRDPLLCSTLPHSKYRLPVGDLHPITQAEGLCDCNSSR